MEQPDFMRTGKSNPLGALTQTIPTFRIADETYDGLRKLAAEAGMSVPEFVRRLIELRVHGVNLLLKIEQERLAVVFGKSQE